MKRVRPALRVLWLAFRMLNAGVLALIAGTCALFCVAFGVVSVVMAAGAWGAWPFTLLPKSKESADSAQAGAVAADEPGLAVSPLAACGNEGSPQREAPATPPAVAVIRMIRNNEYGIADVLRAKAQ